LLKKTEVTWNMYSRPDFVSRATCVFMNMETMLGSDMEKGLRQLKAVAEKPAAR